MKYSYFVLLWLIFFACSSPDKKAGANELWPNSAQYTLDNEQINLFLPNDFKRSSRYRIKEDMPVVLEDSTKLYVLQNALEKLEFRDSEVDVFVDTTTAFRLLIICNTSRMDFSKRDGAILKGEMEANNERVFSDKPFMDCSEVNTNFFRTNSLKVLKFKYDTFNALFATTSYNIVYYITSPANTLIVYEFSDKKEDIERYTLSVKDS